MAALTTSVVVPVKDDADLLERCLRAIATQDVAPDEVVVVDNGSSDDPASVAARYGARLIHEAVPGIPAASAAGYDAATGDLLLRIDADTVLPADWIRRVRGRFEAEPDLAALTGPGLFIGVREPLRTVVTLLYFGMYFGVVRMTIGHSPLFGSNLAVRADAWRTVGGTVHRLDPRVHDDLDLAIHLGPTRRVVFDPLLLVAVSSRAILQGVRIGRASEKAWHTFRVHPDLVLTLLRRIVAPRRGEGVLHAAPPAR